MSAFAKLLPPTALRYRDLEMMPRPMAQEVRYHDRQGGFVFRISDMEAQRLSRVAATAGAAGVMLFLFLKIVARESRSLSPCSIADEIGGADAREIGELLSRLELAGLIRRVPASGGFQVRFVES